jgi:hypothetical protein
MEKHQLLKLLQWLIAIGGLALVIWVCSMIFADFDTNLQVLNTVVACMVFIIALLNIFKPLISRTDTSQPQVASMSLRWVSVSLYSLLAIAGIVACNMNVPPLAFKYQLLIQGILLFCLAIFTMTTLKASIQVTEVYQQEEVLKRQKQSLRDSAEALVEELLSNRQVSSDVRQRAEVLRDELRYISPSNAQKAVVIDQQMEIIMEEIGTRSTNYDANASQINELMDKLFRLLKQRKSIYSN